MLIEAIVGPFVFSLRLQELERETQAGHLSIATLIQWCVRVYHQLLQLGLLSEAALSVLVSLRSSSRT